MPSAAAVSPEVEREQWLEQRKLGIGGSDAAAVFNEGYGCSRALAYDKSDTPPDFPRTERELRVMRRGTLMEELVADEFAYITGRKIRRMGTKVSKDYPFMRVNIDRQILNDKRGPGALEVKTASPWVFREMTERDPDTGEAKGIPIQYFLQLQHALAVTGYQWGAFVVMNASSWDMLTFEEDRHEEWIKTIIEREGAFWAQLQSGTLPAALEKSNDRRCANCMWRKTCRNQSVIIPDEESDYIIDESLSQLAADYLEAQEKKDAYEEACSTIKSLLQESIGEKPGALIPSLGVRIRWKQQNGATRWDSKGLQATCEALRRVDSKELAPFVSDPAIAEVVKTIAATIAGQVERCKKQGAPTRPFYFETDQP